MAPEQEDIQVGSLVTVSKNTFGLSEKIFSEEYKNKTIYPWDNTPLVKGMVGLVLEVITEDTFFVKVLWTVDRQSTILYVRIKELKLLI